MSSNKKTKTMILFHCYSEKEYTEFFLMAEDKEDAKKKILDKLIKMDHYFGELAKVQKFISSLKFETFDDNIYEGYYGV